MKFIDKEKDNEATLILRQFKEDKNLSENEKIYPGLGSYSFNGSEKAKKIIENALYREQGGICAYCMRKLKAVRIEHWYPQNCKIDPIKGKLLSIEYANFLGVCSGYIYDKGVDGKAVKSETFCEGTPRGNTLLTVNPTNENIINQLIFTETGVISCLDDSIDKDLKTTLNLNVGLLKNFRKNEWAAVVMSISIKSKSKKKLDVLKAELAIYETKTDGVFREYCQVAIYYLKKRY